MIVTRFFNVAASTFLMCVQLSASQSMEFQIVLPRDTVDSVSAEFQHAFPQISAANSFREILEQHFPRRVGRFIHYREIRG